MEVQKLPERRMYWRCEDLGIFKSFNYGHALPLNQFEAIMANLCYSTAEDEDQQILDILDAINKRFQAGDYLCLDESMVKAFHKN